LGVAIENQRLLARTRELAIAEERNLVAQGLHDSIAQGLNFLKLQVQMLEDSLERDARDEVREVIQMIEAGLRESYDDVRELLMNFRTKLDEGELIDALNNSAERFRRQTGIKVSVDVDSRTSGAPLPAEQQLQLLFIVQEALSNIRKHAHAQHVHITVENAEDFKLAVTDDGCGFDVVENQARKETHVGLKIMHERAARLGARLTIDSTPGLGTRIALHLEQTARATA
jgi:two-component system nitrate/nitrite sensor histidine kinase NarX